MDKVFKSQETTESAAGGDAAASLRELRHSKGYSLEDLAIATGLTIAEIENVEMLGEHASEHHLERVRNALR
jgi:transcriptional regulator with XRE-family HTH domain